MEENIKVTPAQKQYIELKNQYTDCILFFRMGDFYETFAQDAKTCAKLLDLTLTTRDKTSAHPIPMAGIPYHAADKYIARLVGFGYKVAIAEQMSEPKGGQIVDRQVTQVITPATFIQDSDKEYSYIFAVTYTGGEKNAYQCARGDVTVGMYNTHSAGSLDEVLHNIKRLQPRELIIDIDFPERIALREHIIHALPSCLISSYHIPGDVQTMLCTVLSVQTLTSFGQALEEGRSYAMALLCHYVQHIQPHALQTIMRIHYEGKHNIVMMDMVTIKNLELIVSQYDTNKKYSLLGVLDTTLTALGARLLKDILIHPTNDPHILETRHTHIATYIQRHADAVAVQDVLRLMVDMPKIIASLLYKKTTPSGFGKLRYALGLLYTHETMLQEILFAGAPGGLNQSHITDGKTLYDRLHAMLVYEGLNDDIDYITSGYDGDIDALRQIAYHSDSLLLAYQQDLVRHTGITNIKVKYITNQGYALEITPKDEASFEEKSITGDERYDFIRRQTLKTGQRYTTIYLDELQRKVLTAQFRLRAREQVLIDETKTLLLSVVSSLQYIAQAIARLDVYTSHALFARQHSYTQPEMGGDILDIVDGRHPVIEAFLPSDQEFIPNSCCIGYGGDNSTSAGILHIITGPNMGGKSTFLRQNALLVLLAHCGLFVPASQAKIPFVDGLFARVGSGDVIAKNQSTFMTEMIEMANILHNATKKSFIILDELGRGTSTYDGMALAQAIVQYIVEHIEAKTLFATHYHELIALEQTVSGVKNYSVSVYETEKDVVFMKKIIRGGASKSYGLDVAKIAGIPSVIVETARKYLAYHETTASSSRTAQQATSPTMPLFPLSLDREALSAKSVLDRIKRLLSSIDPNNITPMQALQMIAKLRDDIQE